MKNDYPNGIIKTKTGVIEAMMFPLAQTHRQRTILLATGQLTQYSGEADDGLLRKGVIKSYTTLSSGSQSGNAIITLIHLNANTGVSFDHDSKEIRCTGAMGVFKAAGGETIVVSGAGQAGNNANWTTSSATADKIVLTASTTTESAGASVVIAKQ